MLDGVEVWPVRTNAGFLFNALLHPDFGSGDDRHRLHRAHLDELVPDADAGRGDSARRRGGRNPAAEDEEPLPGLAGLRLNAAAAARASTLDGDGEFRARADDDEMAAVSGFADDERVVVFAEGQAFEFALAVARHWRRARRARR